MKIYVILNGQQLGPYHRDELPPLHLKPDTPVWYQGLTTWTAASKAPATSWIFDPNATQFGQNPPRREPSPEQPPYAPPAYQQPYQPHYHYHQRPEPLDPSVAPSSYLVWSILGILFCCQPLSIVALVYSIMCRNAIDNGNLAKARSCSKTAFGWNLASLITGVVVYVGYLILFIFEGFLAFL